MLLVLFLPVAVMNGACPCGVSPATSGGEKKACLVSLDVCGSGSAHATAVSLDSAVMPHLDFSSYFPQVSTLPGHPAMAVASAYAGETEKPPKA